MVKYQGNLSGESARMYYRWLMQHMAATIPDVRGSIFDFREVTTIDASNTRTVGQSSTSAHRNADLSHIGVALIAKDHYQEQMLRITAQMTPNPHTKRIVRSTEEALAYIEEWQAAFTTKGKHAS